MASTESTQYEKISDPVGAASPLKPNELHGRLRVAFFQHTCESETSSDTITLTKLPSGSRVLQVLWASEDISATTGNVEIGDSGDVDRLVAAFAVDSAVAYGALTMKTPTTETPDVGFGYEYSAATDIILTPSATLNTNNFWGAIVYVVD